MQLNQTKEITLSLLDTFKDAGNVALELREKGLKKETKSDNTPVTNGDIEVNYQTADINGDGDVSILDVIMVIGIILDS